MEYQKSETFIKQSCLDVQGMSGNEIAWLVYSLSVCLQPSKQHPGRIITISTMCVYSEDSWPVHGSLLPVHVH